MTDLEFGHLQYQYDTRNMRFHSVCRQLVVLNGYIEAAQERYHRASTYQQKGFRYNLRLRLAVYEGLRHLMYQYASQEADTLDDLECQIRLATQEASV